MRPVTLHRRWMKSSGHRSNILANFYEHFGFGIRREGGRLYAVAVFGFEADPALLEDTPCSQRTSG